jgi:hypothetical protein
MTHAASHPNPKPSGKSQTLISEDGWRKTAEGLFVAVFRDAVRKRRS